ncbi:unnamed protein product [Cylicostephanus goldi]|uniref:Secreted protein n=1 Tax=Cylicostephanus goldi TaxID=71465 RepID=A0A3P6S5P6_CYLGO|nr:unnamed protein product [Cylicostephanus goldi]
MAMMCMRFTLLLFLKHFSEGGARVVETHGGGPIMERLESTRIEEVVERPLPQPPRPANGFTRDHMGYIPVAK